MGSSAKVLAPADVRRLLMHVRHTRHIARNRVMILLSFKAGLRACEMAGLDWTMVLRPDGRVGQHLAVSRMIAKNNRARRVPIHPELKRALVRLHLLAERPKCGAVIQSQRGSHMTPRGVVNWFKQVYAELGMEGCSSHSGRRTFITRSARMLAKSGGSLRDVQELAGHRALTTTERYIEGDRDAQRRLVRLI